MQIPSSQEMKTDAALIVTSDDTLPVSGIVWRRARFILLHIVVKFQLKTESAPRDHPSPV